MDPKKVILINSKTPSSYDVENKYIPLGLMYLASYIESLGYCVEIKDVQNETLGMTEEKYQEYLENDFSDYITSASPDFIGMGVLFSLRYFCALKIIQAVKLISPNVPVAMGGAHATMFPTPILEEQKNIDYIVMGEGEEAFGKLLNSHFKNDSLEGINGIAYRSEGNVVINPKGNDYNMELDDLPFPAYELVNIEDYYMDTSGWHNPKGINFHYNFPIITSRACPRRCSYCALELFQGKKYRARSAKNVCDEIEFLYSKYDCRYISFVDDNMTVQKQRTIDLMDEIKDRKLDIQFDTSNGVDLDTFSEELLDSMVDAGAVRLTVAIETGSEDMRKKILNKHVRNNKIFKFFKWAEKHEDLVLASYFVIGFPYESHETLNETAKMIEQIPSLEWVGIHKLLPFYGTAMFDYCHEEGFIKPDMANIHNEMASASYDEDYMVKPEALEIFELEEFKDMIYEFVAERRKARILSKNKGVPLEFERMTDLTWQKSVKKTHENKSSVKSKVRVDSKSIDEIKDVTFFNSYSRKKKTFQQM
jgi:anaerobic magnesium-protoporphyrin IX monomethyl ester cyclase